MSRAPRFHIGIDLGTTHTALAYARVGASGDASAIQSFEIPQLIAAGELAAPALLPSLRFHPAEGALAAADLQLPWPNAEPAVLGAFARELGQQTPGRLVASAKSWLSHLRVDREAPILPWGAPEGVPKVSPVEASASYLRHLRAAWDQAHPDAPLTDQAIVLTVPASFDEGARQLTLQAAAQAGLAQLHLIEEPQAAFYDWVHGQQAQLAQALAGAQRLLVIDVGGGTTDLTLIEVTLNAQGQPQLARTGVGEHLILGGDNMDLALARWIEPRLSGGSSATGAPLSAIQLAQLTQQCRSAKERLLAPNGPTQTTVTLAGSGSRLIGGARSATLAREHVDRLLVDGFFPQVAADAQPQRARAGLVEFGLPYAADAAITRHIAAFVQRHGGALPDTVLLNGGVFHARALRDRLLHTLRSWQPAGAVPIRCLDAAQLDTAVARGAVAYAMARAGQAPRIRSGAARAYYLVLDDGQAVCLLPHGTPEAAEVQLDSRRFKLRLGQPVRFNLATSAADLHHAAGDLIELSAEAASAYQHLPPLTTALPARAAGAQNGGAPGQQPAMPWVEVLLASQITEVGTLQVHAVAADNAQRRWKLEFQLRGAQAGSESDAARAQTSTAPLHPRLDQALDAIDRVYGERKQGVDAKEVRQLRATLERLLGERNRWPAPLARALFDALLRGAKRRRRSLQHERVWFNLAGFTLRPGYGDPLDEWRMQQMWDLFGPGIAHSDDPQQWAEWWTLWRRIAGGLDAEQQQMVFDVIAFYLQPAGTNDIEAPEGPPMRALHELLRMAAAFERVDLASKTQFGQWLLQRLQRLQALTDASAAASAGEGTAASPAPASARSKTPRTAPAASTSADRADRAVGEAECWWALGRVAARQPAYASAHHVIGPETAEQWLHHINTQCPDWPRREAAAFAVAQMARATDDRARDLPQALRDTLAEQLQAVRTAPSWSAMVREVRALDEADARRVLGGDALPAGLTLLAQR